MAKKKADKINEVVSFWTEEIKAGIKYKKKYSTYNKWEEYRKFYRGEWPEEILPVNRVFSFGRSLIPQVYFNAPRVTVTALVPGLEQHAKVVEAIDNQLIYLTMLKRTLKSSALDSYLVGTGPIKLGFDSEFGYDPDQAITRDGETATQGGKDEQRAIEYKSYIKPGMPWGLRCVPEDIIVPFGYKYAEDLPWVAHRILRPLDDVKQDTKYANTDKLKGTKIATLDDKVKRAHPFYDLTEVQFAELFEIRDLRDGRITTICEDQILLSDVDAILAYCGLPYVFVIFNEDPEHFWGIPDVKQILEQQKELNDIRTQAKKHRAIALLKFLALKNVIKQEEIDKFLSGKVGPFVQVDAESLAAAITVFQPHVPPDLAPLAMEVKSDMRETLGFNENVTSAFKGGTPPSAAETMQVAGSYGLRSDERKDILADTLVTIVSKWNQMIFNLWSEERVVEVAGPQGGTDWVAFTGDQVKGEYLLRVDPESGFPISRMLRTQVAEKLLALFGGDPQVDNTMLKRNVLEQYEWIFPSISQALNMLPQPLAQGLAAARQPGMMGGRGSAEGNRGGGVKGSSSQNPVPFEKYKARKAGENK